MTKYQPVKCTCHLVGALLADAKKPCPAKLFGQIHIYFVAKSYASYFTKIDKKIKLGASL